MSISKYFSGMVGPGVGLDVGIAVTGLGVCLVIGELVGFFVIVVGLGVGFLLGEGVVGGAIGLAVSLRGGSVVTESVELSNVGR